MKESKYYDELSKGYDELYKAEQEAKYYFLTPWFGALKGTTLDIGAGTGIILDYFNPDVNADYSIGMLKRHQGKNRVVCDARFLPFKDKSFDNVVSITMLQDIREKEQVLDEIERVCKETIIITILKRNYEKEKLDALMSKHFQIVVSDEWEKDYCYFMKKQPIKKSGKLKIKF